jgi:glycosyltransferase involved in cell wall biosynthesis
MVFSPLVSIIIPCYNYGRFLAEALDSLLNQTYQNWECIIVNDGSTDNTEEVARKYENADSRFRYFYQKNKGQWAARNTGITHSLGKYIQYLDADDLLESDKLTLQVSLLEEDPTIDLVYSDVLRFDDKEKQEREFFLFYWSPHPPQSGRGENIINALLPDNFFLPGCVIMRKKVFSQLKEGFRKAYGLEDWDFWFRVAIADCVFYHDPREGTRLLARHHGSNVSFNLKKLLDDRLKVRKEILKDFERLHKEDKLNLSPSFIKKAIKEHKRLMAWEKSVYYLNYDNMLKGFLAVFSHAYYSGRPFFAVYNGAHYAKERVKRNLRSKLPNYLFSRNIKPV